MRPDGTKQLHVYIPNELHDMLRRLSIQTGISATQIIVRYLEYLKSHHYKKRTPLDEQCDEVFKLERDDA